MYYHARTKDMMNTVLKTTVPQLKGLIFFCLLFLVFSACRMKSTAKSEADADFQSLHKELEGVFNQHELMGMSVVLIKDNEIAFSANYGYRDEERKMPITDRTIYRIASISKLFTAIAVMQLEEEGKLYLDEDVTTYLGWNLQHPSFPDKLLTLRLLMSHLSGIRDGTGYRSFSSDMRKDALHIKELFLPDGSYYTKDMFGSDPPGAYFSYSNAAWGIIASIVEHRSGLRFDQYCKKKIFSPLGLETTFNVDDIQDISEVAVLYRFDEKWMPQADHYKGLKPEPLDLTSYEIGQNGLLFGPQGSMRSTALDLARFMLYLVNQGSLEEKSVVKPATLQQMRKPHWVYDGENGDTWDNFWMSYGLGVHNILNRDSADIIFPDRQMFGHAGEAYGLISDMYGDDKTKSGIIFITNGSKSNYAKGKKSAFYQPEEDVFTATFRYIKD